MWRSNLHYGRLIASQNQTFNGGSRNDGVPATFVELGARSAFSGLNIHGPVKGPSYAHLARGWPGAGTPESVVKRTAAFDGEVVGITDLGNVAGVVRAFREGQKHQVRVIREALK